MDSQRPGDDEAEAFMIAHGTVVDGQVLADLEGDAGACHRPHFRCPTWAASCAASPYFLLPSLNQLVPL